MYNVSERKKFFILVLSFHMTDPAPAVRRSVIASIALTRNTIGDVISRTLDVSDNVRRNAFATLAKVRFQNLKITQRVTLLERGLRDRVGELRSLKFKINYFVLCLRASAKMR